MLSNSKFASFFISLLLLLLTSSGLSGQAYNLKSFDAESGLTDQFVYSLIQDDLGFLYVGTGKGLYRFDGYNFEVFTEEADSIVESFVTTSFKDSKCRIWFGHYKGGISLLENNEFHKVLDHNRVKSSITSICSDSKGNIWVATQRQGFFKLNPSDTPQQPILEGIEDMAILSMTITRDDQILLGTDQGLAVFKITGNNKAKFKYISSRVPSTNLQCITKRFRRPGYLIGTDDRGLIEFLPSGSDENDGIRIFGDSAGLKNLNIQSIIEDESENIWLGLFGGGFRKFNDADVSQRMIPVLPRLATDSIGNEIVKSIFQDKFGQVWLGTYGHGLFCLSDETFNRFRIVGDSVGKIQIVCTMEDSRGDYWFGTHKGIYVIERKIVNNSDFSFTFEDLVLVPYKQYFGMGSGLPSTDISTMYQDKDRRIWVGTREDGLAYLDPGSNTFHPFQLNELRSSGRIKNIAQDKRGIMWFGTSDGAFSLDKKTGMINSYSTRNGLSHNNIYDLFPDSKGNVWFSTHTNRISIFNGKSFELLEITETGEVPNITTAAEDKNGNFWFGSDGHGLYMFDGKGFRHFTKNDGLISNYIYQIVIDRYQNIWTTHREGISRYMIETNKIISYPTKAFFPLEENQITDAQIDNSGNIWFSTEYGVLRYNWYPARNKADAPHIFVQSMTVNDEAYPITNSISLPYGQYSIRFGFLGLTFINQEAVRYQYRLIGRSPDWSELSEKTSIPFLDLQDGEYTFQVRACNYFGKCNESPGKVTFVIEAPFWKTWWFRILVLLSIAALVVGYFRYRLYRLRKEKLALEEKVRERTVELQEEKEKVELANIELEKLSLVASETDNAVIILDKEFKMVWINNGFTRLTGFSLEELIANKKTSNYLESSSNPEAKALLQTALDTKASVQYESELPSKIGEKIWVVSTLTPILDEKGNLRNVIIIDSNITERKAAEERISKMNAELESLVAERTKELAHTNEQLNIENQEHIKTAEALKVSNRELDHFVYRASHDLKGPLASMMGLVNIAGMELSDNEVAMRYLGLMDKASKRLDSILIDLIEATQVKQHQVEYTEVNVTEFANNIIANLKHLPNYGNAQIDLEIDTQLVINSDEKLLGSILHNFLANSVRYRDMSKDHQEVKLNVKLQDNEIIVSVSDNGIGIPKEVQHRVFDMFYRGTNQSGGSGLGLYIVRIAVEKLAGQLSLESTEGEGTTFTAKFPNSIKEA